MKRSLVLVALCSLASASLNDPPPANFPDDLYRPGEMWITAKSELFTQHYLAVRGGQSVRVTRSERATAQDPWSTIQDDYSVAFHTTAFASRKGGDQIVIAGLKANGDSIVELWTSNLGAGRQTIVSPPAPPIGEPAGASNLSVGLSLGPLWQPFQQRLPHPNRRTVYEGGIGPISSIEIDPEGRFLLFYDHESHDVYRIDFVAGSPPSAPQVFLALEDHPQLETIQGIEARDFDSTRTWLLVRFATNSFAMSQQEYTVLVDDDNDAVFDSTTFMTRTEYLASPYSDDDLWRLFWKF